MIEDEEFWAEWDRLGAEPIPLCPELLVLDHRVTGPRAEV